MQELVQENKNIKERKPGNFMKIGSIIALVTSIFSLIGSILFTIITIAMGHFSNKAISEHTHGDLPFYPGKILFGFAIFCLIFAFLNIPAIIFNIKLLRGKLKNSTIAAVFTFIGLGICLIGIVCGILILLGKFEDEINKNSDENFLQKNFRL